MFRLEDTEISKAVDRCKEMHPTARALEHPEDEESEPEASDEWPEVIGEGGAGYAEQENAHARGRRERASEGQNGSAAATAC